MNTAPGAPEGRGLGGSDPAMEPPPGTARGVPLLSVVIPALAPDLELRRCVDSLRLALGDGPDWELVVVTPGSAAAEARRQHPGATVCPERRRGIFGAMNDGVGASRGQYLYFLGKDDIVLPSIRSALEEIRRSRPGVVFCDVYWGSRGIYSGRPSRVRLLWRNLCHQGIIYSRRAFLAHGPYLRRLRGQADHYLNIQLLWGAEGRRAAYVAEPVVWYSGTGFSSSRTDPVFRRLYPLILRRHVGRWASAALVLLRLARCKLR